MALLQARAASILAEAEARKTALDAALSTADARAQQA